MLILADAKCLAPMVKIDIVSKFLYNDIGQNLVDESIRKRDSYFIYHLLRALKPRFYLANVDDEIIVEENGHVCEALLL